MDLLSGPNWINLVDGTNIVNPPEEWSRLKSICADKARRERRELVSLQSSGDWAWQKGHAENSLMRGDSPTHQPLFNHNLTRPRGFQSLYEISASACYCFLSNVHNTCPRFSNRSFCQDRFIDFCNDWMHFDPVFLLLWIYTVFYCFIENVFLSMRLLKWGGSLSSLINCWTNAYNLKIVWLNYCNV